MIDSRASAANRFSEFTRAVIVGISDYSSSLAPLPACVPEAKALSVVLTDPSGCALPLAQVDLIPPEMATTDHILAVLASAAEECTAEDVLLFYFAGHGVDYDSGFLLCTGDRDPSPGVSSSSLQILLGNIRARGVVFVLDCCGGAKLVENVPNFFRISDDREFKIFISACRANQSSWELSEKRESLFTKHLLLALSGNSEASTDGAIYFTDLFDYLHTAVQESARRHLGDARLQEPVFVGTFSRDPLLFLHRDLTLKATRIRRQRVTREHLRRRIQLTSLLLIGSTLVLMGTYWAFLDNHQYLDLAGERVLLYDGYPGLTGFGLPELVWEFDFGSELVTVEGPTQIVRRPFNSLEVLDSVLAPSGQVELSLLSDDNETANRRMRRAIDGSSEPTKELLTLLSNTIRGGDETWLARQAVRARPEHAGYFIQALSSLDGEEAVRTLNRSPISSNHAYQLNLLSQWAAPCGTLTKQWFRDFLNREDTWIPVSTVALAAIRSGCPFPADRAILVEDRFLRSALTAVRVTSPEQARQIALQIHNELQQIAKQSAEFNPWDPSLPQKHAVLATRLLHIAYLLDDGICAPELIASIPNEPLDESMQSARLYLLVLLSRACPSAKIRIEVGIVAHHIYLSTQALEETEVLYVPTEPEVSASFIPTIDVLIEINASGVKTALRDMLARTTNPDWRLALVRRLRSLSEDGHDALTYILPEQYMLERELVRWLADRHPEAASGYLTGRLLNVQNSTLVETLAFVQLTPSDRLSLLESVRKFEPLPRVMSLTLVADTQTVAELLNDRAAAVRNRAVIYAPIRPDWPSLSIRISRSRNIARSRLSGVLIAEAMTSIERQIMQAPSWARPWLASELDRQSISEPAVALHLEKLRDRERIAWR